MTLTSDAWPAGATAIMDVTLQQANAAGGAIVVEITPGAGSEFILGYPGRVVNSGTNTLQILGKTAAGGTNTGYFVSLASAAGNSVNWSAGTVTTNLATGNNAGFGYPVIISGTDTFAIQQTGAGAQNDTLEIHIRIRLKTGALPTVTKANSTNPGNVSATVGTLAFTTV